MKKKEKMNPKDDLEVQKNPELFECKVTLLTEDQKHVAENILVQYHKKFASPKLQFGIDTEFKVKLTPKDG